MENPNYDLKPQLFFEFKAIPKPFYKADFSQFSSETFDADETFVIHTGDYDPEENCIPGTVKGKNNLFDILKKDPTKSIREVFAREHFEIHNGHPPRPPSDVFFFVIPKKKSEGKGVPFKRSDIEPIFEYSTDEPVRNENGQIKFIKGLVKVRNPNDFKSYDVFAYLRRHFGENFEIKIPNGPDRYFKPKHDPKDTKETILSNTGQKLEVKFSIWPKNEKNLTVINQYANRSDFGSSTFTVTTGKISFQGGRHIDGTVRSRNPHCTLPHDYQAFLKKKFGENVIVKNDTFPNNSEETEKKIRAIKPQIQIHHDFAQSSDRLNRLLYAKAIAQEIEKIQPPITIGILAKWGSGKTQLLLQIKDVLKKNEKQKETESNKKKCKCIIFLIFALLTLACSGFATSCVFDPCLCVSCENKTIGTNETSDSSMEQYYSDLGVVRNLALVLLLISTFLISFILFCKHFSKFLFCSRILCYASFAEIPLSKQKMLDGKISKNDDSKSNSGIERYIFVDFNAWEYAGSDNLWAAIVTTLASSIEKEFGVVQSRLFRFAAAKTKPKKESDKTLNVEFHNLEKHDVKNVEEVMERYGIVVGKPERKKSSIWEFEFSKCEEMERAIEALNPINNITAVPKSTINKKSHENNTESQKPEKKKPVTNSCPICWSCVKHCFKFPKIRCGFSKLGCWIFFLLLMVAVIISFIGVLNNFESISKKYGTAVPYIIAGFVLTPHGIGIIYLIVKFLLSACQSHTSRINKALKGTKTNMAEQLGFMSKVKDEVQLMTEIVRCAEFLYKRKYRVVISIDDLDRLDLDKVKSVLDAVNILLSDTNSPFVCLIAVDSRIAVKSVEENMKSSLVQSNVTGAEYLKKIINLPFCLPEISNEEKKQFIHGMLTWTDEISTDKKKTKQENPLQDTDPSTTTEERTKLIPSNSEPQPNETETVSTKNEITVLEHNKFIKKCQEFLYNDPTTLSYLDGNPRNIKRIFNILSLTLRVIQRIDGQCKSEDFLRRINSTDESSNENQNDHKQSFVGPGSFQLTEEITRDLVTWVILVDQWPYSMSYILHVIEKNDKKDKSEIKDEEHLSNIFEHVKQELLNLAQEYKDEALLQDKNQDDFLNYLKKLKEEKKTKLNKKNVNLLKKITINLDQSYMQIVQRHSNLANQKKNLLEKNEDGNSDSPSHSSLK